MPLFVNRDGQQIFHTSSKYQPSMPIGMSKYREIFVIFSSGFMCA